MNLKQFIFSKMQKGEYISDNELAGFCYKNSWSKDRPIPFYQAEVYKREYQQLENQKRQFDDKENKVIHSYKNSYKNAKTKYYLHYEGMAENTEYKITKAYFEYLKENKLAEIKIWEQIITQN